MLQLKNPFSLDDEKRADRMHLLLLNMSVVYDPGVTFGELMAEADTAALLETVRNHRDSEPSERWRRHVDEAVALLCDPSLANVPVRIICEVQATFQAFVEERARLHYLYDITRAASDMVLWLNFAAAGGGGGGGGAKETAFDAVRDYCT